MKALLTAALALWLAWAGQIIAQPRSVVVELFTSQGCSSCPPADEMMHKLAKRPDVIALSLHVDYWDYIGWKDRFADPKHSERQRGYARKAGRQSVYTPQMIIGGVDSVVGAHPMDVADLIARHGKLPKLVALRVERDEGHIAIAAKAQRVGSYDIFAAKVTPLAVTKVKRGENAGRSLSNANVVSDLRHVGRWDGAEPLALRLQLGKGPVAVIVQSGGLGPIHAAALLD